MKFWPRKSWGHKVFSSNLKGIEIPRKYIASAIDEFPILFIAACAASGKTILKNAEELKHKRKRQIARYVN